MDVPRFHILVVDDYFDTADSTVELLTIWGYDAIACYSGAAGIECTRKRRPDGVILDLAMPEMDGFQFAELFQKLPECGSVPLIALSGFTSNAYFARAHEAGISHYMLKPADPTCLKDLLAYEIVSTFVSRSLIENNVRQLAIESPRSKLRSLRGVKPQMCSAPITKGCVGM
jgi:CheY-like chemotaxis protein